MPLIRNKRKGNINKSGAITISPKNQLAEIDNQQGQIPIDLSIDGRQLLDTKNHFNDEYLNYNFNSQYNNLKGPSVGFLNNDVNQNFFISTPNTLGVDYFSSHRISKNSLKDVRLKRSLNKTLDAFKEDDLINLNSQESFYLTSSNPDIIKNFDQPVKDRNVINIDLKSNIDALVPAASYHTSPTGLPAAGVIAPMLYYNFQIRAWLPLNQQTFTANKISVGEICLGFSPTIFGSGSLSVGSSGVTIREFISGSLAEPISNFGFPMTSKYAANNDQTLKMSEYITKPFLLEKVIVELDISIASGVEHASSNHLPFVVGNNFFILNQKKINSQRRFGNIEEIISSVQEGISSITIPDFPLPVDAEVFTELNNNDETIPNPEWPTKPPEKIPNPNRNYFGKFSDNTSVRELVTYSKILFATTGSYDINIDDFNYNFNKIENEADYYEYYESNNRFQYINSDLKKIKVEFPARVANKSKYFSKFADIFVGNEFGSRTLLGEDFNRSFYKNNDSYAGNVNEYYGTRKIINSKKLSNLDSPNRESPYILLPDDELVFGFQSMSNISEETLSAVLLGHSINVKLIGTPLSNYRPKKEVRREFQTSNNLRSAVIGNTYLSDQFETGPIQLYAKSSIDRIVTSDSSQDLGRSSSTFYSNGDKGTNKKAVLVTNTDINNVYEDSILSKNSLKYYYNWRRYGHLSDFISQAKNSANVRIKNSRINYVVEKKYFNVTTGISSASSVSSNSDTYSRITLPFIED